MNKTHPELKQFANRNIAVAIKGEIKSDNFGNVEYKDDKFQVLNEPANNSFWEIYLSSEDKIIPFAEGSVKVANESGLDGLTNIISTGMQDFAQNRVPPDKAGLYLASIWVTSINAAMLQDVDPMKNPEYQKIIDDGMNFAANYLNIPDLRSCMELTAGVLAKIQSNFNNSDDKSRNLNNNDSE